MARTLMLPRSAMLATWLGLDGRLDGLLEAVQGDDEPHTVRAGDSQRSLAAFLGTLAGRAGTLDTACLLPVPGDPVTLGPAVSAAAVEAGEAVLLHGPDGCQALVPQIRRFGSDLEPGHHVTWQATPVPDWRRAVLGQVGTPGEADRAMRSNLHEATSALVSLDVSHWWPDAARHVEAVRDVALATDRLPPGLDPVRLRTLTMAARLRAIVELADRGPAMADGVFVADQRATALREIDRAARRALAAASTFVADPATGRRVG